MSVVTNIILTFSSIEKNIKIENQLKDFGGLNLVSIDDKKLPQGWYGGNKFFEANVYLGAYNNFDLERFISHLKRKYRIGRSAPDRRTSRRGWSNVSWSGK